MTILHISTPVSWRGGEQQIAYLIKANKAACHNLVFCPEHSALHHHCVNHQIDHHTFSRKGPLSLIAAAALTSYCKKHRVSVVHCHDSHAHTMAVVAASIFGNKVPVIVHRRVDFPVHRSLFSRFKYNHSIIRRFVCVSEAIREMLVPSLRHPEKALCIHSSIDMSRFGSSVNSEAPLRATFGLSPDTILVGNTAALAPHKDYPTFVRTAALLYKRFPAMRFVIIGDGPLRTAVRQWVEASGLSPVVIFTGFRKDIPALLPELNIFLMTSKTEGLGTSILDAFASKVPVVATRAGGIPELVEDGVTGLLAEVGNDNQLAEAVSALISDTTRAREITDNAYRKALGFDYRIMGEKTLGLYREVLQEMNANY